MTTLICIGLIVFGIVPPWIARAGEVPERPKTTYINVVPAIRCKLCIEEQQRYLLEIGADTTWIVSMFGVDSNVRKINAKSNAVELRRLFPNATILPARFAHMQMSDSLITGGRASGVVIYTEGKSPEFIHYDTLKNRKKQ
ncbi:MAG: hypothetical protein MUC47_10715 [Candidatus Kapabacteria bacterium]|nr:hypothetical protein [Candidatus Kapabacteria bacterium]